MNYELINRVLTAGIDLGIDSTAIPHHAQAGKFYRLPLIDKPRANKSGWLRVMSDTVAVIGNWATGQSQTVSTKQPATEAERKQWQAEAKKAQAQAKREQEKIYQESAISARSIWFDLAIPANHNHPYLQKKRLKPYGIKQIKDDLVIPVYSLNAGKIESLQFIAPNGQKRFLTGGRIAGNFFAGRKFNQGIDKQIVISEGWATSQSLIQHWHVQGWHVVAFNAGNLEKVAKIIRQRYPDIEIIIAGDNDVSGVGQTKALETAKAIGGKVSIPQFTDEERAKYPKCSDWLDRHLIDKQERLNAVKDVRYVG